MKSLFYIPFCGFLFFFACSGGKVRPVNSDASTEARKLLQFLYDIQGEYILAGQHNFISVGSKYTDLLKEKTDRYPIVWGSDFSFCYEGKEPIRFQYYGPINLPDPDEMATLESMQSLDVDFTGLEPEAARDAMVEKAIEKYRDGFIITLMWHACPPGYGDYCDGDQIWSWQERMSDNDWNDLITKGTPLNDAWKEQADTIAYYLKRLRDAGVPVLWRPYHEMNGEWFWWGDRKGEDGFKKLWIMMFDYYVDYHELNNLLWVWNPNAPRNIQGDAAYAYEDYWPGNEFVDVLAVDIYRDDWKQSHYDALLQLAEGKPIAVGAAVPPPSMEILKLQSGWAWFMLWGNRTLWGDGADSLNALFDSNRILTLKDVVMENGNYRVEQSQGSSGRQ